MTITDVTAEDNKLGSSVKTIFTRQPAEIRRSACNQR